MKTLANQHFTNRFATLPSGFYSRLPATPLAAPYLVAFNPEAAQLLDLNPLSTQHADLAAYLSGNMPLPGQDSLAALYAGHQFGVYVPQLGDGRALWLGEIRNHAGQHWEVQLKGSGPTPYSRNGDGRAVLRSSIREYLCSEAMYGLGIPTTRALSITGSDEAVYRERMETAAVVTRLAPSFVRFGSFEVFYYRRQHTEIRTLADFVIKHYYPECREQNNPYVGLLQAVVANTARLIAQWQAVGFCHGVMNTDNMSILGLTIDYGPFGFLDAFDPAHICNHSDPGGRYAFDQQPQVGLWNLQCLAQALLPLMDQDSAIDALNQYKAIFETALDQNLRRKLGLHTTQPDDMALISQLLGMMARDRVDYTLFFRRLCDFQPQQANTALRDMFLQRDAFDQWAQHYSLRLRQESMHQTQRSVVMRQCNPKYILRNYMAEIAIGKAEQERDYSEIERLRQLLSQPFSEQPEQEHYANSPPEWATTLSVSCSS
ncbi:MAG: protein adenylyltransferase SelO [Burkholderiales bacterium]